MKDCFLYDFFHYLNIISELLFCVLNGTNLVCYWLLVHCWLHQARLKMATNTMTACSHCKAQCEATSGSQQVESGFGQFAEEMLGRHIQCELSQSHNGKLSHFKYMMGVEKV